MRVTDPSVSLESRLKEFFGYNEFRGMQKAVIENLLSGHNTFVIMPTGAGKSLCYQLPAIMVEGTALVISPLIALMKNQVDQLNALGIKAKFLNSTLSKTEINKVKKEVISQELKLLYVAPESLTKEENIEFLQQANISFVAIDEAHCISEWGHDFRPEYRRIRQIIEIIAKKLPVIALTATATPKVQADIQKNLHMEEADLFKSSFNRANLFYEVRPKTDSKKQLIKFVKKFPKKSGIIYCLSRKKVEEIAELLVVNDIKALPYHAGLEGNTRMNNQDAFLNEEAEVIVATIAFGMGIDKPDVRFVIHYDAPKSLEGYYQETGRAGRDGKNAHCLMFYSYGDILKLEKFNKDKPVTERDNAKNLLEEMSSYADSAVCRKKQLLNYFGEYLGEDCKYCDNCKNPKPTFDGSKDVIDVVKTVIDTDQRFGMTHLVAVIRGSQNQYVKSYNHDQLDIFGKGKDKTEKHWLSILRQTLIKGYLKKDIENIGTLKITEKGLQLIQKPSKINLFKDHDYSSLEASEDQDTLHEEVEQVHDKGLFVKLIALRKKVAKQKKLPPYVIFQEPSIDEMCSTFPQSIDDLAHINGVGQSKAQKFGKPFIELIKKYVTENNIDISADVYVKSSVNKSKMKIMIIQEIDRKMSLEDISSAHKISMDNLIEEIEHICFSGTKLNLDYYIDDMLDEDRQDEVFEYFMEVDSDKISDAIDEFEDEYSEEELRLMRVKFHSEVAM